MDDGRRRLSYEDSSHSVDSSAVEAARQTLSDLHLTSRSLQRSIESPRQISGRESFRHRVLSLRLMRVYFMYCIATCALVSFLFLAAVVKGVIFMSEPQAHHKWGQFVWEEMIEVIFGSCLLTEMSLSLFIRGRRRFVAGFRNMEGIACGLLWSILEVTVVVLSVLSVLRGVRQLHCFTTQDIRGGVGNPGSNTAQVCGLGRKWLVFRIVLQPLRTGTVFAGTWRTYQMQNEVEEMPVNFACFSRSNSTSSFASCQGIELAVRDEGSPRKNQESTAEGSPTRPEYAYGS